MVQASWRTHKQHARALITQTQRYTISVHWMSRSQQLTCTQFEDAQDQSSQPQSPVEPTKINEQTPSPTSDATSSRNRPISGDSGVSDLGNQDDAVIETASTAQVATAAPVARPRTKSQVSRSSDKKRQSSVPTEPSEKQSVRSRAQSIDQTAAAAVTKEKEKDQTIMKPPPRPSRFPNFSASLPSVPWGGPAKTTTAARSPSPQPPPKDPPAATKRNTPFGWLSRATSASTAKSPPLPPRPTADSKRGTTASVSTLGSNQDLCKKFLEREIQNAALAGGGQYNEPRH